MTPSQKCALFLHQTVSPHKTVGSGDTTTSLDPSLCPSSLPSSSFSSSLSFHLLLAALLPLLFCPLLFFPLVSFPDYYSACSMWKYSLGVRLFCLLLILFHPYLPSCREHYHQCLHDSACTGRVVELLQVPARDKIPDGLPRTAA